MSYNKVKVAIGYAALLGLIAAIGIYYVTLFSTI